MPRVLVIAGTALWLVGLGLIVGNVTGWFPTFPFAGAVVQIVATVLTTLANALRSTPSRSSSGTSVITLAFLFALSAAGWLAVAEGLASSASGSSLAMRGLVAVFFTLVFVVQARPALRSVLGR